MPAPNFNSLKLADNKRLATFAKKLIAEYRRESVYEVDGDYSIEEYVEARVHSSDLNDTWIEFAAVGCFARVSRARDDHYASHYDNPAFAERACALRTLFVKYAIKAGVLRSDFDCPYVPYA